MRTAALVIGIIVLLAMLAIERGSAVCTDRSAHGPRLAGVILLEGCP